MNDSQSAKHRVARAGAALVENRMIVGLGSGTTATAMIAALGERVRSEGLSFQAVATSDASAELARSCGIPVRDLDDVESLDLCLDGADEIDPEFRMIKGRGGALLLEKIVASAARRRAIMITPEKRVERLGAKMPIPVEVCRIGLRHTERRLREEGAETTIRRLQSGDPYLTDGGNAIIDCRFSTIEDPSALDRRLHGLLGVFETGVFLGLCDLLIVGHDARVELVETHVRGL